MYFVEGVEEVLVQEENNWTAFYIFYMGRDRKENEESKWMYNYIKG